MQTSCFISFPNICDFFVLIDNFFNKKIFCIHGIFYSIVGIELAEKSIRDGFSIILGME